MKKMVIILAIIFLQPELYAQLKTVTGKITTFNEIPVREASIIVKSSGQKFTSDTLGQFSIQCASTDNLKISAEGFNNRNVKIKQETKYVFVNLNLIPKESAIELAVGYGHVKDKNKLYAMADQSQGRLNYSQYNSIYEILAGNFPGVQILNGEIIVRSSSSFTNTPAALLIVDGREVNKAFFESLQPSDIAQINILKDASAAVYGSQGANGVVIVVTKRGGK